MGGYLLAVGTLEPRKNLRTLITAYARTPQGREERAAPLVIVGGAGWAEIAPPNRDIGAT